MTATQAGWQLESHAVLGCIVHFARRSRMRTGQTAIELMLRLAFAGLNSWVLSLRQPRFIRYDVLWRQSMNVGR